MKTKNNKSKNVGDFFVLTPIFMYCFLWRCTFEVDIVSLSKKIVSLIARKAMTFQLNFEISRKKITNKIGYGTEKEIIFVKFEARNLEVVVHCTPAGMKY